MSLKVVLSQKRGSILIVCVWMLGLLFLLTISLSRRVNQELLFVKYSLEKMQARYLAWAGFHYAIEKIREDSQDEKSKLFDDAFACGVKLSEGKDAKEIFKSPLSGKGRFEITAQSFDGQNWKTVSGLSDEDGKLNLNALTLENYGIFKELLVAVGLNEKEAIRIAAAALDWRDEDTQPVLGKDYAQEGPFGWLKQAIIAKNRPFDNLSELMFIDGMTQEIYQKIQRLVTVFPRRAERLQINFATASKEVLLALAVSFSGALTNTSLADAQSLTAKILVLRAGADRVDATADDAAIDEKSLNLTMSEENIFRAMSAFRTMTSRFLNIQSTGINGPNERKSRIDAVADRETLTVVSWRIN